MTKQYIEPNEFDKQGTPMKYHNTMDKKRRDVGAKTKVRPETVTIRDTKTGKVYGRRTLIQKSTEGQEMKLLPALLAMISEAAADYTALPDQVVGEIKKNIRKGAADLEQKWKNALELVHKAYQVSNVRRPAPDQKAAWKQYEELLQVGVKEMSRTRGIKGDWRMTDSVVREAANDLMDQPIGKRRFFVDIPGSGSAEVAGENMDAIIDQISNKLKRHGAHARVAERTKLYAVLEVYIRDEEGNPVKRDRIVIKEV